MTKHCYQNVKLEGKRGTLVSSPEGLSFEGDGLSFMGGGTNHWTWDSIKAPYFSDSSCVLHAVKLVFKDDHDEKNSSEEENSNNSHDPIILTFQKRNDFEKMEDDVIQYGHLSPSPLKLTGTLWGTR